MEIEFRIEKDHLQSIADQLSDAIWCFFNEAAADTALNLTNGCGDKAKNIGTFYKKQGKIERIKFWSARELAHGKDSYWNTYARPTSNWAKHADRDSDQARIIARQLIAPQILGAIVDFHQVKERLLNAGIAKITKADQFYTRRPITSISSAIDAINPFDKLKLEFQKQAYSRAPRIDVLSGIFLDWYHATSILPDSTIKRLEKAPPCSLPFGQMVLPLKAAATGLQRLAMHNAIYSNLSVGAAQSFLREETIFLARQAMKIKGCNTGKVNRRYYYLDTVIGENGEEIKGGVPFNANDAILEIDF